MDAGGSLDALEEGSVHHPTHLRSGVRQPGARMPCPAAAQLADQLPRTLNRIHELRSMLLEANAWVGVRGLTSELHHVAEVSAAVHTCVECELGGAPGTPR